MTTKENLKLNDLARLAVDHFAAFPIAIDPKYRLAWFHRIIAERLEKAFEDLKNGKSTNLVIEMPPQHGKSRLITTFFPAWILGREPSWPLIITSYGAELAVKFGRDTRDIMELHEYKSIFGTRVREDSRAKGNWITKEGGGYLSTGIGGGVTGHGFKVGILDDPFKGREEADSRVVRDNVWDYFLSVFMTRRNAPTIIIIVNTRWHTDDLVARIERLEEESQHRPNHDVWEYLTFKAIAEEDELPNRKKGEALWPERFPIPFLKEAEARSSREFQSLYQQHPVSPSNQMFFREWFKYYSPGETKYRNLQKFTFLDPAISEKETADNWVVLTIGKERNSPNIFRLEESVGKGNPDRMLEALFYHQDKYKSDVWIETVAFQKILKRDVKELQRAKQQYFQIHEMKHAKMKTKHGRITALAPLYQAGVIFHLRGGDDGSYEDELLDFPFGAHDDRVDTMSFLNEALYERPTDYGELERPQKRPVLDPY